MVEALGSTWRSRALARASQRLVLRLLLALQSLPEVQVRQGLPPLFSGRQLLWPALLRHLLLLQNAWCSPGLSMVFRLLPRQLLLLPGGTLTLRNDDQRPVTVELSPALPGKPSILLLPGQAQSIRLSSAGELSLSLREQPSLPVHVLLPLHLATHLEVSEQGTMAVATLDVPPGRYVVRLRVPGGEVWQQEVDVPADGRELSLKASLGEER